MLTPRTLNSMAVLVVSGCLAALPGVYQERTGPRWRLASMGNGLSEGRKPFRGKGEIFPLSEGSSGPQPAHPGPLADARDCPAPGDHCTTDSDHGKNRCHSGVVNYPA